MARRTAKQSRVSQQAKRPPAKAGAGSAPAILEPMALRRPEACQALRCGLTTLKAMLRDQRLEEVRIGKISLVTVRSIRAFLGEHTAT